MEPYPSGQCGFIDDPDRQFGNGSVWTRTRTRSDGPEPLLTLVTGGDGNAPMLDEGTRLGLELSRKERQKVQDETQKRQRYLRKKAEGKEKRKDTRGAIKEAE